MSGTHSYFRLLGSALHLRPLEGGSSEWFWAGLGVVIGMT
jgi:hypothetical protein